MQGFPIEVVFRDAAGEHRAAWLSPGAAPPARVGAAGDQTRAAEAVARARRGEGLLYHGDYHGARQLLAAMGRKLVPGQPHPAAPALARAGDLAARFRAERRAKLREHEILSRLLVPMTEGWRIPLRRAPDVARACEEALGTPPLGQGLLPLRDLLGLIGAHEWRHRGVPVPALGAKVFPHYGVFAPVRGEYVGLVARAAERWPVAGRVAFDVGTGTGVLALVLARAGARVVATDVEPRAVACARENAERLGLADRVEVRASDLFPPGAADLVVSNPPWVPETPHTVLDRAVYDEGGALVARLLAGLDAHVRPGGEAWIVISDLAERLGLRAPGHLA
ncbi:MAG TPA: class I SAM-dependent methyltransferase, partial [Anaeromyxobacteraceae bacterium]|nr:class I SAM-dependent methyltransferase [Anaeromyxobacteraceae bacterium]